MLLVLSQQTGNKVKIAGAKGTKILWRRPRHFPRTKKKIEHICECICARRIEETGNAILEERAILSPKVRPGESRFPNRESGPGGKFGGSLNFLIELKVKFRLNQTRNIMSWLIGKTPGSLEGGKRKVVGWNFRRKKKSLSVKITFASFGPLCESRSMSSLSPSKMNCSFL